MRQQGTQKSLVCNYPFLIHSYQQVINFVVVVVVIVIGLLETSKGCCGSGLMEVGDTCKNQTTCEDPHKYVYWDAVHPTERMYEIVTDYAMITAFREIFG